MATPGAGRLQHIVLLDFPQPVTAEEDRFVHESVAAWEHKIGLADECRIGSDISGRAGSWDFLLYTVFADQITLEEYIKHPVHQEFVSWLDERGVTRMAFDYHV